MQIKSPAIDWATEERRRVGEEISVLSSSGEANVQSSAAMAYLRKRLAKLEMLISELERSEA